MTSSKKLRWNVCVLAFGLGSIGLGGSSHATTDTTAVSLPVEMVAD